MTEEDTIAEIGYIIENHSISETEWEDIENAIYDLGDYLKMERGDNRHGRHQRF